MSEDNLADAMAEIQKTKKGIVEVQRLGEAISDENESLRAKLAAMEKEMGDSWNCHECGMNHPWPSGPCPDNATPSPRPTEGKPCRDSDHPSAACCPKFFDAPEPKECAYCHDHRHDLEGCPNKPAFWKPTPTPQAEKPQREGYRGMPCRFEENICKEHDSPRADAICKFVESAPLGGEAGDKIR